MKRRAIAALAAVSVGLLLGGCGASPDGADATAATSEPPQIQSIDGLTVNTGTRTGSLSAHADGTATLDDKGCWQLTTPGEKTPLPIAWPDGTRWADSGHTAVRLTNGDVVGSGTAISAGGGYIQDVARSSVSIAADVPCIAGDPISFVVVNADVTITR